MGSFFAFSFYFLKFQGERYSNINEEQKYEKISVIFNKIISQDSTLETIQTYLKEMGFIQVNDERLTKLLLEKSNLNLNVDGIFLKPIEINNDVFILLASYHEVFLYKDSLKTFYVDYYFIILIGSLILVFLFDLFA